MFKMSYINLNVFLISMVLLVAEVLHSYFLVSIIQAIIKQNNATQIVDVVYVFFLTLLIPICAYFQTLWSQIHAASLRNISGLNFDTIKPLQTYVEYLGAYMLNSPLELNNRIGLGVVSTANYLAARSLIIISLLLTLVYVNPEIIGFITILAVPILISLFTVKKIQKFFGTKMSNWIHHTPKYISGVTVNLIKNTENPIGIQKKIENRMFRFSRYLSVSQAAANSVKPFVEMVVIITMLIIFQSDGLVDLTDPLSLAAIYRVYANGVTAISQYSLIQSSLPALRQFKPKQSSKRFVANEQVVSKVFEKDYVELRGRSGVGKSSLLEYIAVTLMKQNKCCYYLSSEFLPSKITISEFHASPCLFPNLSAVDGNTKIEALSLGQKKTLLLEFAATVEDAYILIDEPFSNLDVECNEHARKLLSNLKARVVITNHEEPMKNFSQILI